MNLNVIVNPESGAGKALLKWQAFETFLKSKNIDVNSFVTTKPTDATEQAKRIVFEGRDNLIVVGGDGTLHECINGLFDENGALFNGDFKLGLLSAGRGCDFARSFKVSPSFDKWLHVWSNSKFDLIDIVRVKILNKDVNSVKHQINSASCGLSGEVASGVQRGRKWLPPSLAYMSSTVEKMFFYKPKKYLVNKDGKPYFQGAVLNLFACNGVFSGGGMKWAPRASINDGKIDVLIVKPLNAIQLSLATNRLFDGTISELPQVETFQTEKIEFVSQSGVQKMELDGEVYDFEKVSFEALPKAINFMC